MNLSQAIARHLALNLYRDARFNNLAQVDRVEKLGSKAVYVRERMRNEIIDNLNYAHEQGIDKPEMGNWKWPY